MKFTEETKNGYYYCSSEHATKELIFELSATTLTIANFHYERIYPLLKKQLQKELFQDLKF